MTITWIITECLFGFPLLTQILKRWFGLCFLLLILNFIFISYFWLNGLKDIFFVINYYKDKSKNESKESYIIDNFKFINKPSVALIYVTCDDFISDSLLRSMNQTYDNYDTYILDDSKTDEYKNKIDLFQLHHPEVHVVRRKIHEGFKAGNINHFLKNFVCDYFVILDSDEIIPNDFIEKALPFFKYKSNLGILQCNHISTRNHNKFMKTYYCGVNAHWPTYQSTKEKYGFLSFLGHGAMIKKECYDDAGGFPEVVAEDVSFSLEANFNGWKTGFSSTIICEEQFPVDYMAFKKRLVKWTGGNLEFIKNYTKKIFKSKKFSWFEKLDILLFVYSLPLTYVFSAFLVINLILLPLNNESPSYYAGALLPTVICFFSPVFNDIIYNARRNDVKTIGKLKYNMYSLMLYGSMYYSSLSSSFMYMLGNKPKFIVTPKKKRKYGMFEAFMLNKNDYIFCLILFMISFFFDGSLAPVSLLGAPILCEVYLTRLSSKE